MANIFGDKGKAKNISGIRSMVWPSDSENEEDEVSDEDDGSTDEDDDEAEGDNEADGRCDKNRYNNDKLE